MPFKLYLAKNNLHRIQWLKFIKIGSKSAEIAVLEQPELKTFFATQPCSVAFKESVDYKNVRLTKFSLSATLTV